jgi:phosphoribosyl 1,2-cyclic phosphodiesterase
MKIIPVRSSSAGNGYILEDDRGVVFILDCGVSFREMYRSHDFHVASVAGCLISHEHGDHSKYHSEISRASVPLYVTRGTGKALGLKASYKVKIIEAGRAIKIESWTVVPFPTVHDAAEPVGFLLSDGKNKILFATDTAYITNTFVGLTHVMIECNYQMSILNESVDNGRITVSQRERIIGNHFGLENVLEFFNATDLSRLQEVYLLHLSSSNSNEKECVDAVRSATGVPVYACKE